MQNKINDILIPLSFILMIIILISISKTRTSDNYQQQRIEQLQKEVDKYEKVNPKEISEYFTNKYKKEHEKIDSNDLATDIIYLQNLLAE